MALRHESEQSELFPWLHTEGSAQEGLKREPSFREAPAFALGLFCLTLACGVGLSGKREGPGVGIRSPKPPTLLRGMPLQGLRSFWGNFFAATRIQA